MARNHDHIKFNKEKGYYEVRINRWVDGKKIDIKKRVKTQTEAIDLRNKLVRDVEDHGKKVIDARNMTFTDLSNYYEEKYIFPPQYIQDKKVAGMRSYKDMIHNLKILKGYFEDKKIRSITTGDIEAFKAIRLQTATHRGKQRSIANVNKELSTLRRVLRIAVVEGWLNRTPFASGAKLISTADEIKRTRVLSREEEEILLTVCVPPREHLRGLIICALDLGLRRGELLSLQWSDVDFSSGLIHLKATNTKTLTSRTVAMTSRVERELNSLCNSSAKSHPELVFNLTDFKNSFHTACRLAGISGLRFHDLRHTAATRMVQMNIPLVEVGRVLGHTQIQTTLRYSNLTIETAKRAAMALDIFNEPKEVKEQNEIVN